MSIRLVQYDAGSSSDDDDRMELTRETKLPDLNSRPTVDESMIVEYKQKNEKSRIDLDKDKIVYFNPKYDEVVKAKLDSNLKDDGDKNFLTGHIEDAHIHEAHFEEQRKLFHNSQFKSHSTSKRNLESKPKDKPATATDPDATADSTKEPTDDLKSKTDSDVTNEKRKRLRNDDPSDIDNFVGPWAEYENEIKVSAPTEEEKEIIDEYIAKKKKVVYKKEHKEEDKSILHINDPYDYQGRSFLHPPHDLGINFKYDHVPEKCFLPKKTVHTYNGHSKSVTGIRWFPVSAHLFLSCAMDNKIKLWEVYNERRCILTYLGHRQAVRDICFNRSGEQFVSCGYDKALKLWNTETGQCVKRFDNRKVAYCVKFNTDYESSHLFLTGMSDKKILCWDCRSGAVVQEYDRHLGAVNTINLIDGNRRFVTTSDDKSLRVWEWNIPVDIKYIADPSMHAIPAVSPSPNGKWLACQFMDNKIQAFTCLNRFKLNSKKVFKGHMVAGYSCAPDFSPDMSYLISGDADGKIFIWNWKTTQLLTSFKAHDNVCTNVLWHPHETSKVLSCSWDNLIRLWE